MISRILPIIIGGLPILFILSLFVWASISNDNDQNKPGVNTQFGEVELTEQGNIILSTQSVDNVNIDLLSLRGKIVIVDFWSSWCVPCRTEAPILSQAYKNWNDQGVEFIGIAIWDTQEDIDAFIQMYDITYPVVRDDTGRIAIDFGVSGIPEKFFIRPDGTVAKKVIGPISSKDIDRIITDIQDEELGI